ncbi:hypothetical protein ACFC0A_24895, partial [Kitasatospora purpeofusca]
HPGAGPARLDQRAAVELGSITAAAYEGCAAVRAVCAEVTADIEPSAAEVAHYRALTERPPSAAPWRLALPDGSAFDAAPDTLPLALADALGAAAPGEWVTVAGWTAARLAPVPAPAPGPAPDPLAAVRAAARRTAFVRWLDHARAARLTLVPGLEHPGDPAQPDNHHRHRARADARAVRPPPARAGRLPVRAAGVCNLFARQGRQYSDGRRPRPRSVPVRKVRRGNRVRAPIVMSGPSRGFVARL